MNNTFTTALAGAALLFAALFVPTSAHAEEKNAGHTWSPEVCDFAVTFPEAPYASRKCPDGRRCYEASNFTKVFGMHSTVNFRVTCNKAEPGMFERYDGGSMKAVLRGMADANGLANSNAGFQEYDDAKVASLTGTGQVGRTPMIYAAQLWIGESSVFTIEGELIGEDAGPADALFSDVISSIRRKDEKWPPEGENEQEENGRESADTGDE
ncbi:MAG: hypothetical protein EOM26_04280 [Alphaproteobacteria bacterium]|nr:hypothetical protein [Alphaproteobacteria bacterium]